MPAKTITSLLCALLLAASPVAQASAVASTGALLNQAQAEFPSIYLPSVGYISDAPNSFTLPEAQGGALRVNRFRFTGNTAVADATLQSAFAPYAQRDLSPNQIYALTALVKQIYKARDIAATALVPPQDVDGGVVQIDISESTFAGVELDYGFEDSFNVDLERIESVAAHSVDSTAPLYISEVERGQLLAIDLHGVAVSGGHHPDGAGGEVLELWVENTPKYSGTVDISNAGNTDTGELQTVLTSLYASPFGRGGATYINGIKSEQLNFASLAYRGPLGLNGATIDVQTALLHANVEGASTNAKSYSLGYRYPLLRSVPHNLFLTTLAERRDLGYNLDTLELSLDGNRALPTGRITYNSQLKFGTTAEPTAAQSSSFETLGGFINWRENKEVWRYTLHLSGQLASRSLDDADRMIIGGTKALRGYSPNDFLADRGALMKIDISRPVAQRVRAGLFYDQAFASNLDTNRRIRLRDIGAQARWQSEQGPILSVSLARALDSVTGGTSEGDTRLYAKLTIPF